jgi:hypothetical protein
MVRTMKQRNLFILLAATVTLLIATACSGDSGEISGLTLAGRGLTMNVSNVQKVDTLTYQDVDSLYYSVGPVEPGYDLVVAKVTIWNTRSGRLSIFVDGDAATLEGSEREKAFAIDPYQRRHVLASAPSDLGHYTPLLWGPSDLPQDFNIIGWMAFEVPEDVDIKVFRWEQVDLLSFPVSVN